ncbi:4-hydroxy-tetrahydrodipicolinate reductase [Clostridium grantii]|uniref:4-hydroxy-tetrahydrodipicolinate reductase n=1 Tax=Clostridium grantii DSM 8605 TaxID=1121316 RepID=A0A1M5Y0T1_9CLOT|nr:4-hydroxy-tetrahydrodipicolinate reductase [Clostridium grantii]SHI05602.1 dihydrodipicolinate reductase [Clostridium grantii DSM 8605]
MIKILMVGCSGRMGKAISQTVDNFENLTIVAGIDRTSENGFQYPIFEDISSCTVKFDVILDFSRPDTLESLINFSKNKLTPIVLCTTGYTAEQLNKIKVMSETLPLFRSANMSIGINVVNSILKNISGLLFQNYDIEIIEKHHNQKVDSPSGTAILLADTIKDSIPEETKYVYGREGIAKREHKEIGIHAIRGGSIVGDHSVIFAGQGEIIELNHTALSREVFAVGALKACEFMNGKQAGMYSMDDVIKS